MSLNPQTLAFVSGLFLSLLAYSTATDESNERRALRPTPPRHPLLASRVPSQSVISASSSAFVSSQKEIGNMDLAVRILWRLVCLLCHFFLFFLKQQDREGKQAVETAGIGYKTVTVKK